MTSAAQTRASLWACATHIRGLFEQAGAMPVDCDILQPAETLLDLYGEDIRTRAYVTADPTRGEVMLRPDFTVPVVQRHMAGGATPARYTYAGPVFRRQETDPNRRSEFLQVGYELFDGHDPADADAEVFAMIRSALGGLSLRASTGDLSILSAAVDGLRTTAPRKAALLRHLWRPARFRDLLDRYAGRRAVPPSRLALLAADAPMDHGFADIGLRSQTEVAARIDALRQDAAAPTISTEELGLLDALLRVQETCTAALGQLQAIAVDLPAISDAVDRFARRCDAMAARGVPVEDIGFEASYGRTTMEYYGGFVFGFADPTRPDLPAVATGGRYDALCARLGSGGAGMPAVGGVIRPDSLLALNGETP